MNPPPNGTEDELAAQVDAVRLNPEHRARLVELLAEQNPVYVGRSTNAAIRIKGYILAAFEHVGLPAAALPYVLEELESGRSPYVVAAAAKAVRGLGRPAGHVLPYLLKAVENVTYVDDTLSFDGYWARWPAPNPTTAVDEIVETVVWLGPEAAPARPVLKALVDNGEALSERTRTKLAAVLARLPQPQAPAEHHACCSAVAHAAIDSSAAPAPHHAGVPEDVELEDQDGRRARFDELVRGRPSIVTFFYTRCENPNKCSLTITKLARLQKALAEAGLQDQVRTLAVTYDPQYDRPARLRLYGEKRGVRFDANNRCVRAVAGFEALRQYFDLGVNFGPALVNVHRIELFVLDHEGRIASTFARLQWDPDEVLERARTLLAAGQVAASAERV